MRTNKKAFTLIEIIIVVIIVGILAGLSVAGYSKAVVRSSERTILDTFESMHEALRLYRIRTGGDDFISTDQDATGLNNLLNIHLMTSNVNYTTTDGGTTYTVEIVSDRGFTLRLNTNGDVCCSAGNCGDLETGGCL